jgi:hypothetical protein
MPSEAGNLSFLKFLQGEIPRFARHDNVYSANRLLLTLM